MKKVISLALVLPLLLVSYSCGPKARSQSDVDTPEYHYKAGMRYIETEEYSSAIKSFQRSVDLDKKFALGWAGLGLATGLNGDLKQGRKFMDKGLDEGKKNPDVRVLAGRLWIAHKGAEKKWLKAARKEFERALKLKKLSCEVLFRHLIQLLSLCPPIQVSTNSQNRFPTNHILFLPSC